MITKTITTTDYNGVEYTEEFRFNLTKAELMEWELSIPGGLTGRIKAVTDSKNAPELIKLFRELIKKSYGVKSADGRRFIKSEELYAAFEQTEAYSEIFMELITDADKAAAFVNGIMPNVDGKEISRPVNITPVQ